MIDLYFWTTPNGYKPLIFLEEAGLAYTLKPVNISKGDQFKPDFLKISPNNRIPAIVDQDASFEATDVPLSVFESGAILQYLAEKSGKFLPASGPARSQVLQWLNWQMGGIGPMFGQYHHFVHYAYEDLPYAKERYTKEVERLLGVLDKQLASSEFMAGEYSIADMATYPWIVGKLETFKGFPNVQRWVDAIAARPAVQRAYAAGKSLNTVPTVTEESKALLFGGAKAA